VVTWDSKKPLSFASSINQELVTVIKTISGVEVVLPLMIIVSRKLQMENWFTKTNLPGDVLQVLRVSETRYSNDVFGIKWLHHFDKYSADRRTQFGAWQLLLLDRHNSHCTHEFIQFCDDRKIILFCLPPHSTHLLQPLDVVVFQPYKHYYAEAIDNASRTGCSEFDKIEFLTSIDWIRCQTFKPTTICFTFKATGLLSFNPSIVINKLSNVVNTSFEFGTQRFESSSPPFEIHSPSTPSQLPEPNPTTAQIIRLLKKHAQLLHYQLDQLPQHANRSLQKYLKGSLALAQSGPQALLDLENTKAAELACTARRNCFWRSIQQGGVFYAHEARAMVLQKV